MSIDRYTVDVHQGGTMCSDNGEYVLHSDYAELQDRLRAAEEELHESHVEKARIMSKRAMRVSDLQDRVRTALDRRACPPAFMDLAVEAISEFGCGEIADLKKKLEVTESKLQAAQSIIDEAQGQEPVVTVSMYNLGGYVHAHLLIPPAEAEHLIGAKLYLSPIPAKEVERGDLLWNEIPEDSLERLDIGKATSGDQVLAVNAIREAQVFADMYTDFAGMIEPYVARFLKKGELPASVIESFQIVFEHWVATKDQTKPQCNVPDGWKLVPILPTYEMCKAGGFNWEGNFEPGSPFPARYARMLEASPGAHHE